MSMSGTRPCGSGRSLGPWMGVPGSLATASGAECLRAPDTLTCYFLNSAPGRQP